MHCSADIEAFINKVYSFMETKGTQVVGENDVTCTFTPLPRTNVPLPRRVKLYCVSSYISRVSAQFPHTRVS